MNVMVWAWCGPSAPHTLVLKPSGLSKASAPHVPAAGGPCHLAAAVPPECGGGVAKVHI